MTVQPIKNRDQLISDYVDIRARIERLTAQADNLKAQLRDLGVGKHEGPGGVVVTVAPPARRFNLDRAITMLTPEQLAVCQGPVAAKVKGQLPPVLLEQCMDPGTGDLVVTVK